MRCSKRMLGIIIGLLPVLLSGKIAETIERPVDMVFPHLDSANSRWFFFSSACRPFGMVNLSPDNQIDGAWGSGYRYNVDTVKGFSHIHAWQLAGVSVMPLRVDDENRSSVFKDYVSEYSHETEVVSPGYHSLYLDRYNIKVELTSTKRVGFHRYAFPSEDKVAILFNLNGMLGPSLMMDGLIKQTGKTTLEGQTVNSPTIRRSKACPVFFKAEFDAPVSSIERDSVTGNYLVLFDDLKNNSLLMKVAISYTSTDNAALNMQAELKGWDFQKVVEASKEEWNSQLSRIEIEGGTQEQQRRFYTDLWRALQGRRTISDVNGSYPDHTGAKFRIGQIPLDNNGHPTFNHYNSDAFWGAQWTLNTLWGLVYPEMMEEFTHSMMLYYKDGGLLPRGPSGGNYTFVMTGASSTPFIVSAIQKDIVKDDLDLIYEALKKNHMPGGIMEKAGYEHDTSWGGGLKYYLGNGYVPYPNPDKNRGFHNDGAGMTLEYAYQDWTLAQLAKKLGREDDYHYFFQRSGNYKNLYDHDSGWMRPRNIEGKWREPFDPFEYKHGFVESNSAQATWFVPHDLPGLADLMGGKEVAANKLNQSFETAKIIGFTSGDAHEKELHPEYVRIPINYGNQPSIQTAFIFNYFDQPWLTQKWSREVTEAVYEGLSPQRGYNGDEDQGLMGALAVLMKLGIFSMDGGCSLKPFYELGSPLFDEVTIHLNPQYYSGEEFVISVKNNSSENRYIQSATLNGQPFNSWIIPHQLIVDGGKLILNMANKPMKSWGVK
jgi:predicted alpha-1,2-mannosidase